MVCGLHQRVERNHFTSKQSPAEPEVPFSPTELWHTRRHYSALNLFSLASQNQAVTPGHTCLALNTCSYTLTLMQANPPVSPLSALQSEWLITNLTPGGLESCTHLRSLRGLLLRESDRREMQKWNCQPGCYADTLGANRMKLGTISWVAVHIKCVLLWYLCCVSRENELCIAASSMTLPPRDWVLLCTDMHTQTVLGNN